MLDRRRKSACVCEKEREGDRDRGKEREIVGERKRGREREHRYLGSLRKHLYMSFERVGHY